MSTNGEHKRPELDDGLEVVNRDAEGLQVAPDNDYPEVVVDDGLVVTEKKDYPEVAVGYDPRCAVDEGVDPLYIPQKPPRKWQRVWVVVIAIVVIIGLALGLGLGIGLRKPKDSPSDAITRPDNVNDGWDESLSSSKCNHEFCTTKLAATTGGENAPKIYLMWQDEEREPALHCFANDGLGFEPCTTWSNVPHATLETPSKPAVAAWSENGTSRVDAFAISAEKRSLIHSFEKDVSLVSNDEGYLWGNWTTVTQDAGPLFVCMPGDEPHVHFIRPSNGQLRHVYWDPNGTKWTERDGQNSFTLNIKPETLVVGCIAGGDLRFDAYGYDTSDNTMVQRQYVVSGSAESGYVGTLESSISMANVDTKIKFIGEPLLLQTSSDLYDLFTIGENKTMYHNRYRSIGAPKETQSLEGSFVSNPAAVSGSSGNIEVVAVGSNGHLKYGKFDGSNWGGWEDMGINANGAPFMRSVQGKIFLVYEVENREIEYISWEFGKRWQDHSEPIKLEEKI